MVGSADGNLTITAISWFSMDGCDEYTSRGCFSPCGYGAAVPQTRGLGTIRGPWRGYRRSPDKSLIPLSNSIDVSASMYILIRGFMLSTFSGRSSLSTKIYCNFVKYGPKALWKHLKTCFRRATDIYMKLALTYAEKTADSLWMNNRSEGWAKTEQCMRSLKSSQNLLPANHIFL